MRFINKELQEYNPQLSSYHFEKYSRNYILNGLRYFTSDSIKNWTKYIYGSKHRGLFNFSTFLTSGGAGGGAVGGWKELGRTTLGGAADTITVSSLANKRHYMTLADIRITGGSLDEGFRYNSDSGTNYSNRRSDNGAADSTNTSLSYASIENITTGNTFNFHVGYHANYSTKEKLGIIHEVMAGTAGAANAPDRSEAVIKWANTTDAISSIITGDFGGAGQCDTNSELVVLGLDPADTHTDNFWVGQGSQDLSSSATMTFTAKKYMRFMMYFNLNNGGDRIRVGAGSIDTGTNYAYRDSFNGGADTTGVSQSRFAPFNDTADPTFLDCFVINVSSKEKLFISHTVSRSTAGAGNAPQRSEGVWKWVNTSSQMDRLQLYDQTGGGTLTGEAAIWGSD